MKRLFIAAVFIVLCLIGIETNANTIGSGTNITIDDKNSASYSWAYGEDQEVEPGMTQGQEWDLEAMYINNNYLSVVGGYDFVNGKWGIHSGDLFLDVNGDAEYGDVHTGINSNVTVKNTFGYDYVFDLNFDTKSWKLFTLNDFSYTITANMGSNQGSNPWKYSHGGEYLASGEIRYASNVDGATLGLKGGNHKGFGLDLTSVLNDVGSEYKFSEGITAHFTMACGNDNLMGNYTPNSPVPEPGTFILLGLGMLSIAGLGRKRTTSN